MTIVIGLNGKLYKNTGTYGSPTWTLVTKVQDLEMKIEADQFEVSNRAGGGFKEYVNTLVDVELSWNMPYDPSDTLLTSFQTAARPGGGAIEFLCLDGPQGTTGSQGLRVTTAVKTGSGRSEKLSEAMTVAVSAKPTPNSNAAPAWYTAP